MTITPYEPPPVATRMPEQHNRPTIQVRLHGEMFDWLANSGGSLIVTTYNSGKLAALSVREGRLSTRVWKFPRPMGLAVDEGKLALAARDNLWVFQRNNDSDVDHSIQQYRAVEQYRTGRLDMHDVAFGRRGVYFVNTKFNCLARPSSRVNFLRSWQPWFITEMAPRDRCHLNGLGMRDGRPAMATAFGQTDEPRGWRSLDRFTSGLVIDVRENRAVVAGLCMPHSPRFRCGAWWVCNSGAGTLCQFDPSKGTVEEVAALPGFTRGLCFVGNHALVGLSKLREKHVLDTPPLRAQQAELHAGVALVDTQTGRRAGGLEFVRGGSEVYEVGFLPDIMRVAFEFQDVREGEKP